MELDRDDLSFHVHPCITLITAGAGFLDMTRTAPAVLLAECLTGGILLLDHSPILIDCAADSAVA
jgi:hypothetical protein